MMTYFVSGTGERSPDCNTKPIPWVDNAAVSYSSLTNGSTVQYICNDGFQRTTNDTTITCNNGSWTTPQVRCIPDGKLSLTYLEYCKCGNFRVGVIFAFFAILPFSRKFPPRENKTQMTLLRKYEKYRENYPHVKGLDKIFAKFPPSENNHVYSSWLAPVTAKMMTLFESKFQSHSSMKTTIVIAFLLTSLLMLFFTIAERLYNKMLVARHDHN